MVENLEMPRELLYSLFRGTEINGSSQPVGLRKNPSWNQKATKSRIT